MSSKIFTGAAVFLLLFGTVFLYNKYRIPPAIKFETLELYDLDGARINLEAIKGKKIFVNFFGTWCGPCMAELPLLEEAQAKLEKDNFMFLCISDESLETLNAFHLETHTPLIILRSAKKLTQLKIHTVPTAYLLNDNYEIVYKKTGEFNPQDPPLPEVLKNALH